MIDVPAVVGNKARSVGAHRWLDELDAMVRDFEREWSLTAGAPYPDATEAVVLPVELDDGSAAILKLVVPRDRDAARDEITVLELCAGAGCARLLRSDRPRGALLIERLGPSLHELGWPIRQRHDALCDAASKVWRPAADAGLQTGAHKARWLIEFITATFEQLDHPCSNRAVDYAIECATGRIAAHDDERSVLVHGDIHQWNLLRSTDGFKLIDPDGLLAEPEYDLGIIMREDPLELLVGDPWERARRLAARAGLDALAIWEWGVVERVSTGLLCTAVDLQPVGRQMLHTADVLTRH